nr:unnamed protein product [Digitaria exilis]
MAHARRHGLGLQPDTSASTVQVGNRPGSFDAGAIGAVHGVCPRTSREWIEARRHGHGDFVGGSIARSWYMVTGMFGGKGDGGRGLYRTRRRMPARTSDVEDATPRRTRRRVWRLVHEQFVLTFECVKVFDRVATETDEACTKGAVKLKTESWGEQRLCEEFGEGQQEAFGHEQGAEGVLVWPARDGVEAESIETRYRRWVRDPAIRWAFAMADNKTDDKTPPSSPRKLSGGKGGDGAGGSGKEEAVRVVREIGGLGNWPMLTKENYTEWALVMKIKMKARNLWNAIEPGGCRSDGHGGVPGSEGHRVGSVERAVRKTKAQRLRREFESLKFKKDESVDDFVVRLSNLVAALSTVDEAMADRKVVEKLLRAVPKRLATVAVAIEVSANMETLTLEDAGGRLHAAEEREAEDDDEEPPMRADGKLYLTEEQWEVRRRERRDKERARSGGARHGKGSKKGGRSSGHGDDSDDDDGGSSVRSGTSGRGRSSSKGKCFNCGVRCHFSRECPKPRKEQAIANTPVGRDAGDVVFVLTFECVKVFDRVATETDEACTKGAVKLKTESWGEQRLCEEFGEGQQEAFSALQPSLVQQSTGETEQGITVNTTPPRHGVSAWNPRALLTCDLWSVKPEPQTTAHRRPNRGPLLRPRRRKPATNGAARTPAPGSLIEASNLKHWGLILRHSISGASPAPRPPRRGLTELPLLRPAPPPAAPPGPRTKLFSWEAPPSSLIEGTALARCPGGVSAVLPLLPPRGCSSLPSPLPVKEIQLGQMGLLQRGDDLSSPAKGLAARTATAENTKDAMIAGRTKLLVSAMISGSFSLRVSPFDLLYPSRFPRLPGTFHPIPITQTHWKAWKPEFLPSQASPVGVQKSLKERLRYKPDVALNTDSNTASPAFPVAMDNTTAGIKAGSDSIYFRIRSKLDNAGPESAVFAGERSDDPRAVAASRVDGKPTGSFAAGAVSGDVAGVPSASGHEIMPSPPRQRPAGRQKLKGAEAPRIPHVVHERRTTQQLDRARWRETPIVGRQTSPSAGWRELKSGVQWRWWYRDVWQKGKLGAENAGLVGDFPTRTHLPSLHERTVTERASVPRRRRLPVMPASAVRQHPPFGFQPPLMYLPEKPDYDGLAGGGLAALAAAAENTKNTMIAGTTNLLTTDTAMISSFSLRLLSLLRLLSPHTDLANSSPSNGRATPSTTENTMTNMITGRTRLLSTAMISRLCFHVSLP